MLFNSYEFIFLFLPLIFFAYRIFATLDGNARKYVLLLGSLIFYGYWNYKFVPLIVFSIGFNYCLGQILLKEVNLRIRKLTLIIGVLSNLGLLGYFKYADFILGNINQLLDMDLSLLGLVLPLAISFFTFQQIAYLVDCYRYEVKEYSLLNYSVFVLFFPQLIAGPIVHHKEILPQLNSRNAKYINYSNIGIGLVVFSIGMFKKVAIADSLSEYVNYGFDEASALSFMEAWAVSLGYTYQLYYDFSGYSDMAIGLALLFNVRLPANFLSPYKAANIQEFWRRWHITLSYFLRDYLYISLGGSRKGQVRTLVNLMVTFLLGGLWHGAGWMFVLWGGLHGGALIIHRLWMKVGISLWKPLSWIITFLFVNFAWVVFRAKEWDDALKVYKGMVGLSGDNAIYSFYLHAWDDNVLIPFWVLPLLVICTVVCLVAKNSYEKIDTLMLDRRSLFVFVFALFISMLMLSREAEFLYFEF